MYYKRTLEDKVRANLDNDQAVIVTGMRRVGKTTLLRQIYQAVSPNRIWFDFDNPLDVKYFEDSDYNDIYRSILRKGNLSGGQRLFVFIDEVQKFPTISRVVKYLIDHYHVKFFLTGSASYYLKNLFPESLAGRKVLLEMYPLDFAEFLQFRGESMERYQAIRRQSHIAEVDYELYDAQYEEFLMWGGFPEVVLAEGQDVKHDRLNDIFSSYYQQEVINLADFRKGHVMRDLIELLAARVGSKLDVTKLSQELGVQRATLYSYLAFLQDTYFIHLISRASRSRDRAVSGTQKVYFCDNGILQQVAQVNAGQLLENAVFNQLKHRGNLRYYRKKNGREIDFVLNQEIAYEVKRTASPIDIQAVQKTAVAAKANTSYVISQTFSSNIPRSIKYAQFI